MERTVVAADGDCGGAAKPNGSGSVAGQQAAAVIVAVWQQAATVVVAARPNGSSNRGISGSRGIGLAAW